MCTVMQLGLAVLDYLLHFPCAHAQVIRDLLTPKTYVIVVEHDLAVLDYLSDFICCLYGKPGAYGVVTMPFSVREGINIFLAGFVPTENLRFREEALTFKVGRALPVLAFFLPLPLPEAPFADKGVHQYKQGL